MKAILVGAVFTAILVGAVIFYEGRIGKLQQSIAELKEQPADGSKTAGSRVGSGLSSSSTGGPDGKSGRVRGAGTDDPVGEKRERDGDWAETFRKMLDNPVGRAMIAEEQKAKALRIYGDLIDSYNFTKEEKEYFLNLVAAGVGEEDTVGMKMFSAESDEERMEILDKMESDQVQRKKDIEEFLNSDEDYERFAHFDDRKDIYEQLPGLRAAVSQTGTPISEGQEESLVEAMFEASVESGIREEWDGRAGMEQFGKPGATDRFNESWDRMQGILAQDLGTILDTPEQQAAVREHQTQVGNMARMGIQFVEGMIQNANQGNE